MKEQCVLAATKASWVLGRICNPVASRSKKKIIPLYLECVSQIWSSQFKRNLEVLEMVQWKATEMIRWLENLTHEQRLKISFAKKKKKIGLLHLQKERLREI